MNYLNFEKLISKLPDTLTPNTMYLVRVGEGIDIYVTDITGSIAHKHNMGNASGPALPIFDDNIPVAYWNIIGDITVNGNYTEMPPPNTNMICVVENTAIYNNNTYIKDDIYIIGNTIDDIQPIIKPPPAVIPNAFNIGENISITPKIVMGSNSIIDNRFIVPLYYSSVL